jgi:hypothetical protein
LVRRRRPTTSSLSIGQWVSRPVDIRSNYFGPIARKPVDASIDAAYLSRGAARLRMRAVTVRQCPGTAKGEMFVMPEVEPVNVNAIVWPSSFEK